MTLRQNVGTLIALSALVAACAPEDEGSVRPSSYGGAGGRGGMAGTGTAGTAGSSGRGGAPGVGGVGGFGGTGTGGSGGSGGTAAIDAGNDRAGAGGSGGSSGSGDSGPTDGLLFEDFEDGNADGWIADVDDGNDSVGDWAVVTEAGSKVYKEQKEYSDPSWAVGGDVAWTDQVVETKVQFVSSAAGDPVAFLAVRLSSKDRYYFLEFHANETDASLKVRKRVNGSTTDIISSYKTGMPVQAGTGTWYTIGLSAVGTTISASLNGKEIGTATDSALTNGGVAVGIVDAVAIFDNVKVTAP